MYKEIKNSKIKAASSTPFTSPRGFTLIELLVTVTIIGLIGILLTDLLFRSFQSSGKTQIQGIIQQNGQSALNLIDQAVRYTTVVCASTNTTGSIVTVKTKDESYVRFRMVYETIVSGRVTANGYITHDTPLTVSPETDLCDSTSASFALNNPNTLTDTGATPGSPNRPGVSVRQGGKFTISDGVQKDTINIDFLLGPGKDAGLKFESQAIDIPFQTSIVLR